MQTKLRRDDGQPAVGQTALRTPLAHQTHRPLPELVGIAPRSCHELHPSCTEWSLHGTRGGSVCRYVTCNKRPATPIRAPPCATTVAVSPLIGTLPTSSPRSSPAPPAELLTPPGVRYRQHGPRTPGDSAPAAHSGPSARAISVDRARPTSTGASTATLHHGHSVASRGGQDRRTSTRRNRHSAHHAGRTHPPLLAHASAAYRRFDDGPGRRRLSGIGRANRTRERPLRRVRIGAARIPTEPVRREVLGARSRAPLTRWSWPDPGHGVMDVQGTGRRTRRE